MCEKVDAVFFVLFGSMLFGMMVGCARTLGVFFIHFQYGLEASASAASLAISLCPAVLHLMGPVAGWIYNIIGPRKTVVIASVLCVVGMILTSVSPSMVTLQLFLGVFTGPGLGIIQLAVYSMAGEAFKERRSLANNIITIAITCWAFGLGPIMQLCIDEFGWRGALLVMGGIMLNGVPFGLLASGFYFRMQNKKLPKKNLDKSNNESEKNTQNHVNLPSGKGQSKVAKIVTTSLNVELQMKPATPNETTIIPNKNHQKSDKDIETTSPVPNREIVPPEQSQSKAMKESTSSSQSEVPPESQTKRSEQAVAVDTSEMQKVVTKNYGPLHLLKQLFDKELLTDWCFVIFCLAATGFMLSFMINMMYVVRYGQSIGIDDYMAVWIAYAGQMLSVVISPISGMVTSFDENKEVTEPVASQNQPQVTHDSSTSASDTNRTGVRLRRSWLLVLFLVIYSVVFLIPPVFPTFAGYVSFATAAGVTNGLISGLPYTVMADLFGIEKLPSALGVRSLFVGIALLAVPPLMGLVIDTTGSYFIAIYVASGASFLSAIFVALSQIGLTARKRA